MLFDSHDRYIFVFSKILLLITDLHAKILWKLYIVYVKKFFVNNGREMDPKPKGGLGPRLGGREADSKLSADSTPMPPFSRLW